jgi:hypothetical protein
MIDNSVGGRGKGAWQGDNQSTASSFFLVYNPIGRPVLTAPSRQQLGYFQGSGDVANASSPAANSVNQLVEMVVLNYLALHDNGRSIWSANFANSSLNSAAMIDAYSAFQPLSTSTPPPPPPPPGTIVSCGASGVGTTISGNHGHVLVVPVADVDSTVPMTYSIRGTAQHDHMVTLSVVQLQTIKTIGSTVTQMTIADNTGHTHNVTVSCA